MTTQKTESMETFLSQVSNVLLGHARDEGVCVTCGSSRVQKGDFRDILSLREYNISRMCQSCQDMVFTE